MKVGYNRPLYLLPFEPLSSARMLTDGCVVTLASAFVRRAGRFQ
jgi:hypothetical protein